MGLFFAYIVKSTICLTLFYLFYRLLLSKDTFHRFNRIALLSLILLSVVIPFINISTKEATVFQYPMLNLEQFLLITEQPARESVQISGLQILIILYISGILFFAGRLFHSVWTITGIIKSGEKIRLKKNVILIITNYDIAPFSWIQNIVISRTDWENNRDDIIAHETAHIRYCHSWDVFISELCTVFHWFNPAAWLLKQELQNIHEYEADESVINQGIDAKRYQLLLIKKAVGSKRFNSMANSFNHSKLKKRITMMLKSKSNAWARLKYLYVLPLAAITTIAFARPEISRELNKISSTKISELPFIKEALPEKKELLVLEQTPISPTVSPQKKVRKTQEEIPIKEENIDSHIQRHVDELTKNVNEKIASEQANIQSIIDNTMTEINNNEGQLSTEQEAKINKQVEQAIKESEAEIERYVEEKEKAMKKSIAFTLPTDANVVIVIDGITTNEKELHSLNPEDITDIDIQMNKELAAKYGEDLKGVIFVETKKK